MRKKQIENQSVFYVRYSPSNLGAFSFMEKKKVKKHEIEFQEKQKGNLMEKKLQLVT